MHVAKNVQPQAIMITWGVLQDGARPFSSLWVRALAYMYVASKANSTHKLKTI